MKSKKTLKTICATIVSIGVIASQAAISVAAAGVTVSLNEQADALGYTIRGYYMDASGNYIEVSPSKTGSAYTFAGVENDKNYESFYYDVYDYNGNLVTEKSLGYAGNLAYMPSDFTVGVTPDMSFNEAYAADLVQNGNMTADEAKDYLRGVAPQQTTTNNTPANSDTNTPPVQQENTYTPVEDVTQTGGVLVNITSDYNIEHLTNSLFTVVLTATDGTQYNIPFPTVRASMSMKYDIPDGDYSVAVGVDNTFVGTNVSGDTTATVTNGYCTLNYKLEPACILQVVKTGATDCQFAVEANGVRSSHNINAQEGKLGVVSGGVYTVTDLNAMKQFTIQIPSNVALCQLDIGTIDGAPVNDRAQEDAVLSSTASPDNPYNIPQTNDVNETTETPIGGVAGVAIVAVLAVAAIVVKKTNTK